MKLAKLMHPLAAAVLCIASATAQTCTSGTVVLSITPANPMPGTPLAVSVTGTPGAQVVLFRSAAVGVTTLTQGGPLHNTVMCLASPLLPIPLGIIPASGVKTTTFATGLTAAVGLTYTYQAATLAGTGMAVVVDTSNTSTVTFVAATPPPPPVCAPGTVVLAVAPSSVPAGTAVSVMVTGTPGAAVQLFRGAHAGASNLGGPGPLHNHVVCLNAPFFNGPLGLIPASGILTVQVPTSPNAAVASTETFQVFTITAGSSTSTTPVIDSSNTSTITFMAPPAPAPCTPGTTQLVILPDTQVMPGNTVSLSITGTVGGHVFLVAGPHLGSLPIPMTTSTLCLGWPVEFEWLGTIPASGTLSFSHVVPLTAMLPGNIMTYYQAVVITGTYQAPVYDVSNTDSLLY